VVGPAGRLLRRREHPADAAVREAREELGIEVRLDGYVGMYVDRYAFQGETLPVLNHCWTARSTGAEATSHGWLSLMDAPEMAFRSMDRAIADVRGSLAGR
jgi:8-oxo-dGTP pyrophosphatase MutT (NUDIX family)